jgi:hypothetical protein
MSTWRMTRRATQASSHTTVAGTLGVVTETNPRALPDASPPVWARVLAVVSILIAGAAGGLIGWSVMDLQCTGDCSTSAAIAGVIGALSCAVGVAVVATLTLRAMSEWRAIENRDRARRDRGLS